MPSISNGNKADLKDWEEYAMQEFCHLIRTTLALCLSVIFVFPSVAAAEGDATVEAFASLSGRGQIYPTGPNEAMFVGDVSGVVYIMTKDGPVDVGLIVCPATVEINSNNGAQTGSAKCTVTAHDGARAFATLGCKGRHLVGCRGNFQLTGGTDRLEGLSGEGPVIFRSRFHDIVVGLTDSTIQQTTIGIAYWPALRMSIPPAAE
jgi:hypothetical protein